MNAQQTANATDASSTGALGTAVDRMSFAHDIVMMTDEAIAIGLGVDIHVRFKTVLTFRFINFISFSIKFINLLIKTNQYRVLTRHTKIHCVN